MEKYLSPYLWGFRKGYSAQYCLMIMLERWNKALDNKKIAGVILTDLSKAFNCLHHELLIAKLEDLITCPWDTYIATFQEENRELR